ncbi:hypothetical protein GCM10010990_11930 [Croceicoccus mobilis]|uniref:histidine kinase n=2 Tax=Croceicoccus mobilis TaxID=1703339 RepID=A0A916YWB4_9SPHN|nr:hypothetical protein GCM10010990_11930 [Croceicoccus mobilis]
MGKLMTQPGDRATKATARQAATVPMDGEAGHWLLDAATGELQLSPKARLICGFPVDGRPDWRSAVARFAREDRRRLLAATRNALASGEIATCDIRRMRPDGEIRRLRVLVMRSPAFGSRQINGVVTEQRPDAPFAGDEAHFDRHRFFGQLAHELYNPLNGIIGFSDLMMRSGLPAGQEERAAAIACAARAMQHHVENVMTVHGEGRLPAAPDMVPVDIACLARDFARRESERASPGAMPIVLGFQQAAGIWARSDAAVVSAILQRLIAITGAAQGSPLLLGLGCAGDRVELTVQDHACRTARQVAELQSALRGDAQCISASDFAMAAAARLAASIQARIAFEATPWPGHMATLSLPALLGAQASAGLRPKMPERVLLAEDDEICRMLIAQYAASCDVILDIAENGAVAVAMVEEAQSLGHPYALVLMDLRMPVMDGFAAARRLRALGHGEAGLPIIAVSANCSEEDVLECRAAGMQDLMPKPFMVEEFESCMVRWLPSMQLSAHHPGI